VLTNNIRVGRSDNPPELRREALAVLLRDGDCMHARAHGKGLDHRH